MHRIDEGTILAKMNMSPIPRHTADNIGAQKEIDRKEVQPNQKN